MRTAPILALLACIHVASGQHPGPRTAPDHGRSDFGRPVESPGRAAFEAGRYGTAKKYFERELRLSSLDQGSRVAALANAAMACLALGQSRLAGRYYSEAVAASPGNAALWHGLGQALYLEGDADKAEQAFRQGLDLDSANPNLLNDLATVYLRRNEKEQALSLMRSALESSRDDRARARILRNLAVLECHLGACKSAVQLLGEALRLTESVVGRDHPDTALLWRDYSEALARTGEKAAAKQARRRWESMRSAFMDTPGAWEVDWRDLRQGRPKR